MATTQYINSYIDTNNPNIAIQTQEESNIPKSMSFPSSIDSMNENGRSKHTMIISVNKNATIFNEDKYKKIKEEMQNELTKLITDPSSFMEGSDWSKLYGWVNKTADERVKYRLDRLKESKRSFSFYMPSPILFENDNEYSEMSLTERVTDGLLAASQGIGSGFRNFAGNASKLIGFPINPKVEILFENIKQRRFGFEFLFAPISEKETRDLKEIIKELRMAQAPEKLSSVAGLVWRAPSTFDITFKHNGVENTNIPRIDECVMTHMEVDYTPGGPWVTFRNGYPAQVRMRLAFMEKEPNDREMIERGF